MNDVSTRATSTSVKYLRLPLLLVTGLLTMGSGMGNPGCGTGSPGPSCDDGCFIEGTWRITYVDSNPLPQECQDEGVELPRGPLKLTRVTSDVLGTIDDRVMRGRYYGRGDMTLDVWGDWKGNLPTAGEHRYSFDGELSNVPASPNEPLTWTGKLTVYPQPGAKGCVLERAFTANR